MDQGGCLCGAVRFQTTGPLREVVFCHCSQCRKQTGLYFAATNVAKSAITITGDALRWFHASTFARRGFCGTCGSALFWERVEGDAISIMAGAFDDPAVLTPGYHICTQGRGGFYSLNDGLPQYPTTAPGLPIAPNLPNIP